MSKLYKNNFIKNVTPPQDDWGWLDIDIVELLSELSDEVSSIFNHLKYSLNDIKRELFKEDLTIYFMNIEILKNLGVSERIIINDEEFMKVDPSYYEYSDIDFISLSTAKISHASRIAPKNFMII